MNDKYNLRIKWLVALVFPSELSKNTQYFPCNLTIRHRHRSVSHTKAMRQTALFQLINVNRQDELIPAPTVGIQNRDDVHIPDSQELEGGHPGKMGPYLSIDVSPPQIWANAD